MGGVHDLELGECQLDEVMLLERFEDVVAGILDEAPRRRVEDLLFDRGVDGQSFGDALNEVLAPLVGAITRLLEADEQLLDLAVVVGEYPNRIARWRASPLVDAPDFVAVRSAAPTARVTGSAAFLAARAAFFGVLVPVRLAAALVPADLRAALEAVRVVLFDLVDNFFVGAMRCRYPAVTWRNPWTLSSSSVERFAPTLRRLDGGARHLIEHPGVRGR